MGRCIGRWDLVNETRLFSPSQPHLTTANSMDHHHPQSLLPYHQPPLGPLGLHHPGLPSRPISPGSLERMRHEESKNTRRQMESQTEKLPLDSNKMSLLEPSKMPSDSDPSLLTAINNNNNNVELQHAT